MCHLMFHSRERGLTVDSALENSIFTDLDLLLTPGLFKFGMIHKLSSFYPLMCIFPSSSVGL